jgi:hypothetical protein
MEVCNKCKGTGYVPSTMKYDNGNPCPDRPCACEKGSQVRAGVYEKYLTNLRNGTIRNISFTDESGVGYRNISFTDESGVG